MTNLGHVTFGHVFIQWLFASLQVVEQMCLWSGGGVEGGWSVKILVKALYSLEI